MKRLLAVLFGGVMCAAFFVALVKQLAHEPLARDAVAATRPPGPQTIHADGRVAVRPGKQVTLGSELMARVAAVNVVEGQRVKKGDVLAELDGREYQAALREALGSAGEAYARLKGRRDDVRRSLSLVQSGALAKQDGDRAKEEQSAARARLVSSNASAARARALLDKTRIVSPIDGTVIARMVDPSETVAPGRQLFTVADLTERRVEAEVDEFDIGRVALGLGAEVFAEGSAERRFPGTVEEIPSAVGPRKLRPQDPARPVDSSVLLVKVTLPPDTPFKLGQRVSVVFTLPPESER